MSTISSQDDLFASLGLAAQPTNTSGTNRADQMGLNTFLKLMVTQLNNQDPFKPMENGEFLSQIAQFGSVTGLDQLNQNFESLAASITSGQALQAGSLVGREVLAPVETGYLVPGDTLRGQVQLDQSSPQVTLRVTDQVGQLVREMSLGSAPPGAFDFSWDGIDDLGNSVQPGFYTVEVEAVQNDRPVTLQTRLFARVESVNLSGSNGLTLNLDGLGPIAFNNVQQIY
ncbi:MAG: flagellar hook assembly protein FlgD [Gammaproteobacteria bacterium]|nr:flagellar hook assembly protein FlgD [Gammaproteobacteria bacterium]MCB1924419.1 flagellar hook assembly protein FlgD [Gammaproteobacteria bacterium]